VAVRGDLSRLFGSTQRVAGVAQSTPEAPSRFKLLGVMAPRSPAEQAEAGYGLALIAVDGKPAKPYAVGARLDSDLVLQSVGLRTASLGPAQGARSVLLELPVLAAPNSGVLPPPGIAAPVPAAATTKMQAAQAAVQAAQAAQAVQAAQGGQAVHAAPAAQAGFVGLGGATPGAQPAAAPALGPAQAPVMQQGPAVSGPALPPPAPSPMPTPGGLPSQ
jgi:general secretion pathway protein C